VSANVYAEWSHRYCYGDSINLSSGGRDSTMYDEYCQAEKRDAINMVDKYRVMFWTACRRRICWSGQDVGLNGDDLDRMEEETVMLV
jgi:hypothetical protein